MAIKSKWFFVFHGHPKVFHIIRCNIFWDKEMKVFETAIAIMGYGFLFCLMPDAGSRKKRREEFELWESRPKKTKQ